MMMNSKIIRIVILIALLLAVCCGRKGHDPRLERIWEYVSDTPETAMRALDSIDALELSESDRVFYNLTSIKAKDKAYVVHSSDSLILTVIDYYSHHKDKNLYAEALYYGGRVYCDLGDYPTSLKYFQKALDLLPEDSPNLKLRCRVLSQTGGLLNDMALYHEAIPYLNKELKINQEIGDTVNIFFDCKLLGAVYLHLKQYQDAKKYFDLAENLSVNVPAEYLGEIKMYQAAVSYEMGEIQNALEIIRPIPKNASSLSRNLVLAYASTIYRRAGVLDTAYMYARELAMSEFQDNRKTGYMVMLSPELRHLVPKDSLDVFYDNYKIVLETTFKHQEDDYALLQNAMYNYRIHDRQKQAAERTRDRILFYVIALVAVVSILSALILWLFYNRKSNLLKLHQTMEKLDFIESAQKRYVRTSLEPQKEEVGNDNKALTSELPKIVNDEKSLKEELRVRCKKITENVPTLVITSRILISRPYLRLQRYLKSQSPLPNEHNIYIELENVVSECYPEFKTNLLILSGGNLRGEDFELCLLIRCGFTPKELAILLGRSNSTITYRRKKLGVKLLGEELDVEVIDNVIRAL